MLHTCRLALSSLCEAINGRTTICPLLQGRSYAKRFNDTYITSTELQREMNVTRAALLYARRRGTLPEPIVVNDGQLTMWERSIVEPYLREWKYMLAIRRGQPA